MKVPHKIWILILGVAVAMLIVLTTLGLPGNLSPGTGSQLEPKVKPTSFEQVGRTVIEKVVETAGFRSMTRQ